MTNELTVGGYVSNSDPTNIFYRVKKLYEKKNPGVKVTLREYTGTQMDSNASLLFGADDAPDVVYYNQGTMTVGNIASQGILHSFNDVAKKYGWDTKFPSSITTIAKYDSSTGVMSEDGDWYGLPYSGEFVFTYYNKDMFDEAGIAIPTTMDELEAAMQQFVDKGITPVAFEGAQAASQQLWYQLALTKADRQWVNNYQSYANEIDWDNDEPIQYATKTFNEWVEKGYLPADSAGLQSEDMIVAFTSGKYPIMFTGSWQYTRAIADSKFNVEFGLMPGLDGSLNTGATGKLLVVPETAKNKARAYDFMNFMLSEEVQNMLATEGTLPLTLDGEADINALPDELKNTEVDWSKYQDSAKKMNALFDQILDNDGLAMYPDWPSQPMAEGLNSGLQTLINKNGTVTDAVNKIKTAYNEGKSDLGID